MAQTDSRGRDVTNIRTTVPSAKKHTQLLSRWDFYLFFIFTCLLVPHDGILRMEADCTDRIFKKCLTLSSAQLICSLYLHSNTYFYNL